MTSEPHEIAQGFAKHFHTAIMKIRQTIQRVVCFLHTRKSPDQRAFRLSVIKEDYVCKELKGIKTSKPTGLVNIPARLLKDGADALASLSQF